MGQYAMEAYEGKVMRSVTHRKTYAAGMTLAKRTDTEYETYMMGEVAKIKAYLKAKADLSILGTGADTAMDNIEDEMVENNDAFRGEFGRHSDAVKDLEPVSRRKKNSDTASEDARDPVK